MESKIALDELLDELNSNASSTEFITYAWWPEKNLKLQLGGKNLMRIISPTPEESYSQARDILLRMIREQLKIKVETSKIHWS
jgi:hypothetical protein